MVAGQPGAATAPRPLPWLRVHLLTLVGAGAALWYIGRDTWFFADDWEFVVNRGLVGARLGIWVPHVEHWSTGPILIWRLLLNLFGLHSYLPFLLLDVLAHLVVGHLLWRLAGRGGVSDPVRTWAVATYLVANTLGINPIWAFQISFNGALALGLGALLLVERRDTTTRHLAAAAALCVVMMTFCSVSLPILVAIGLLTLVRHGVRATGAVVGPAATAFVVWYAAIGHEPIPGSGTEGMKVQLSPSALDHAGRYAVKGLGNAIGRPLQAHGWVLWPIAIGFAIWCVVSARRLVGDLAGPAAAAVGGVAFYVATGLARVDAIADPLQPRYLMVSLALLLPLAAAALDAGVSRATRTLGTWVAFPLAAVAIALSVLNGLQLRRDVQPMLDIEKAVHQRVLAGAALLRRGEELLPGTVFESDYTFDLTSERLQQLTGEGWVPSAAGVTRTDVDTVRLSTQLATSVASEASPRFETSLRSGLVDRSSLDESGCLEVAADGTEHLGLRRPVSVTVDGRVTFDLGAAGGGRTVGAEGASTVVDVAIVGRDLSVTAVDGRVRVCDAR